MSSKSLISFGTIKSENLTKKPGGNLSQICLNKLFRVEQTTLDRHQDEMNQFHEELDKSIPLKPKDTAELLNLRAMEDSLARQEE